ncbi:YIP1 family protein [Parageobacillus toebii]|uniref:YIP1 family protein n=1 Tax=Parageobacillus toebii TaxID=153151 RepID=UPI002814BCAF|nr:YIP1 family protein [Parageobacillus toebii]WMT19825.1 YIP1 family protein [Parageobacillus toebii]
MFQVRLWHGILHPSAAFMELQQAETVRGFFRRLVILALCNALLSGLGVYMGLDTERFTALIGKMPDGFIETAKLLFAAGAIGHGLIAPMIVMYITSLLIWLILRGKVSFEKIMTIELYAMFIYVIEHALFLLFRLITGANVFSSPFGLGIIAQLAFDHLFLIYFFQSITIFSIWGLAVQTIGLTICSSMSKWSVLTIVAIVYLFIRLAASLIFVIVQ